MSAKLQTIDAETLLATPLKPVPFIVDGLIPCGLHILAGSPKIGKSWLVLWLCLKVAKGELVWEYTANRCGVLYLCLEDTFNRIQNRLFEITDTAPANLHFAVLADLIGAGLQQQIEGFLKQEPETRLIVIDTLQRVRGMDVSSNAYANDYRDICGLKQLADKHRIAIVLVHHLRKNTDKDPFMMVSGTTGLTGGVDTTYVLEKGERSDNVAKLYVTGRDVEYISEQAKFLHRCCIDNEEQLAAFHINTEQQIAALTEEHKKLSNEKRHTSVPEERKVVIGKQISELSVQLKRCMFL